MTPAPTSATGQPESPKTVSPGCLGRGWASSSFRVGMFAALLCVAMNLVQNHAGLHPRHRELGGEYFEIAVALAEGRGFADPFHAGTGATGWMPPAYSVILWVVNFLTGGEGREYGGAFIPALIALKCLCLGTAAGLLWSVLRSWGTGGAARAAAFFAAWIVVVGWAQWDSVTTTLHDGWWIAFLAVLCLQGMVSLRRGRAAPSLVIGMALAAFSSPVLFVAVSGAMAARACALWRVRSTALWRHGLRPALPALVLGWACFAGWSLRVHAATGIWAPVKTNGGFELWQTLENSRTGVPTHSTFKFHPYANAETRARYVEEGEKAFLERHEAEAFRLIAENPGRFLGQVGNRAANAFVLMERRRDTFQVGGHIPEKVSEELVRARLLVPASAPDRWDFLFLRASDAERERQLARLSPEAGEFLRAAWQLNDADERKRSWWGFLSLAEIAVSGLPTLAWIAALAWAPRGLRRRVSLALWLYLGVLGPYVLVSHYYRYQEGVMGLQVLALAVAILCFLRRFRFGESGGGA